MALEACRQGHSGRPPERLVVRAGDLEVLGDEHVVRPQDADVVHLVVASAQLHHTVNDAAGKDGLRGRYRRVGYYPADQRARTLRVVRRDYADGLIRSGLPRVSGQHSVLLADPG